MRELWLPKYMDRRPYTEWQEKGDNACDWANAEARRILETHQPEPLEPVLVAELERMIVG
jgi:trimethylamine:corrinoid methyltransferase-like protein